jgi:hypothetical protein
MMSKLSDLKQDLVTTRREMMDLEEKVTEIEAIQEWKASGHKLELGMYDSPGAGRRIDLTIWAGVRSGFIRVRMSEKEATELELLIESFLRKHVESI